MNISALAVSGVLLLFAQTSFSAGMEKSSQTIMPFLEPGNYAELGIAQLKADISGQVQNQDSLAQIGVSDFSTGNLVNKNYLFITGAVKLQLRPDLSVGFLFDKPFGTDLDYRYRPETVIGPLDIESVRVKFDSNNISIPVGYQPDAHWNFFAGPVLQTLKGEVELGGQNYYLLNGYTSDLKQDFSVGWLAGLSYQIPEIAFRTSLSYRSPVKHTFDVQEQLPIATPVTLTGKTTVKTPQSVNFDIQTAVSTTDLIYASLRWVEWKDFYVQPPTFQEVLNAYSVYDSSLKNVRMIQYNQNQLSAKAGLIHKWNSDWSSAHELSWDSGTDDSLSTLNPSNGYLGIGGALIYHFNEKSFFAIGLHYVRFRKASRQKSTDSNVIASLSEAENNHAIIYGFKTGFHF